MQIYDTHIERRKNLVRKLDASAGRISDYHSRLMTHAGAMTPTELEHLMDDYRAEQVRYDNLSRELDGYNTAVKTAAAKERWRKQNRDRRKKLHY
mgnify:CR=1 FL=1